MDTKNVRSRFLWTCMRLIVHSFWLRFPSANFKSRNCALMVLQRTWRECDQYLVNMLRWCKLGTNMANLYILYILSLYRCTLSLRWKYRGKYDPHSNYDSWENYIQILCYFSIIWNNLPHFRNLETVMFVLD